MIAMFNSEATFGQRQYDMGVELNEIQAFVQSTIDPYPLYACGHGTSTNGKFAAIVKTSLAG